MRLDPLRATIDVVEKPTRARWLIPVIAAGFLVVLAVWVVTSPAIGQPKARPEAAASRPTGGSGPAAVSGATVGSGTVPGGGAAPPAATPPASSLDQTVPDSPPAGVSWDIVETIALPSSATAGPAKVADGVPSGFAHSPTGALIAATQISLRLFQPNWKALSLADIADTPGRVKMFQLAASAGESNPANPQAGSYLQIAGFSFVSYTPTTSVIQLLMGPDPNGNYNVGAITVRWDGGDWQLVMEPDGVATPNVQTVSSVVGFVVWAGV